MYMLWLAGLGYKPQHFFHPCGRWQPVWLGLLSQSAGHHRSPASPDREREEGGRKEKEEKREKKGRKG